MRRSYVAAAFLSLLSIQAKAVAERVDSQRLSSRRPILEQEIGNPFKVYCVACKQNAAGRQRDGGDCKIVCSDS